MPQDPVADILKAAPLRDDTRAEAWDAFSQSTDADDLAQRIGRLPMPEHVKAQLWDLKKGSAATTPAPAVQQADEDDGGSMIDTIGGVLRGANKGLVGGFVKAGEFWHQMPGVSKFVDALYGTPGLSQRSFEDANKLTETSGTAETVGKLGFDVGTALATGGPIRAAGNAAVKAAAPALSRVVGKGAADLLPRVGVEMAAGGALSAAQGGDPTAGAVLSGAIPVAGKFARAGVNAVLGGVRHTPAEAAAVKFAEANGIPLDAATATGRKVVEIVQKRTSDSLGGAGVSEAFQAGQETALKTTGEKLAGKVSKGYVTPEQAGSGVREAINKVIGRYKQSADTHYDTLRQIEADPSSLRTVRMKVPMTNSAGVTKMEEVSMQMALPVNIRRVKAMLKPIYEQMNRTMAPTIRDASPGYTSLKAVMESPDYVPASIIDLDLSQIKSIVRGAKSPDLRNMSQGIAAAAVKELDQAVSAAVAQAGPKATAALRAGRSAHAAKEGLADTFKSITDAKKEPVAIFDRLTKRRDGDIQELRALAKVTPAEMPKLGRAVLDGLLDRAGHAGAFDVKLARGLYVDWQKLGPETKKLIFPDAAHRASLDRFFTLTEMIGRNPNPSGTARVMTAFNLMSTVPTYALAKILYSPAGVRQLTKGITTGNQSEIGTLLGRVAAQQAAQVQ